MSHSYTSSIKRLKWIIKNWGLLKTDPAVASDKFKVKFQTTLFCVSDGLCSNAHLPSSLKKDMFETFPKYSGHITYPLSDFENYATFKNFTETPQRLELAKHCLKYLKKKRKKERSLLNESNQ